MFSIILDATFDSTATQLVAQGILHESPLSGKGMHAWHPECHIVVVRMMPTWVVEVNCGTQAPTEDGAVGEAIEARDRKSLAERNRLQSGRLLDI